MNPNYSSLLGSSQEISDFYIKPFTIELEKEILSKSNQEQKADLIKWYVTRLMKSENHKSNNYLEPGSTIIIPTTDTHEVPPVFTRISDLFIAEIPYNASNDLKYLRGSNILYHSLFDELQKCCCAFKIPFLDICMLLGFPIKTINISISETCEVCKLPRSSAS